MTTHDTRWNLRAVLLTLVPLLSLLSACCSSGRASPPDDPAESSIDKRVHDLLSGYEMVPTAADWARIGTPAEVSAALMRVAAKPDGQMLQAARATSSLAFFPRPEVATFLEQRLSDDKTPNALRGKAAIALAVGWGDVKAGHIVPLFTSPDEDLREDAVRAFKRFASPAAERFLDGRIELEPSERLKSAMTEAKLAIAEQRSQRTKANNFPKDLETLAPIADPGPVRRAP